MILSIAEHLPAFIAIATATYLIAEPALRPWAKCRGPCGGSGHGFGSTSSAWNTWCRCGGSGKRLRPMAHLTRRDLVRERKAARAARKG